MENNEINKDQMRRLFCVTLDEVINKKDVRFSHQNTKLYAAVSTLQPENINFFGCKDSVASFGFSRPHKCGSRI